MLLADMGADVLLVDRAGSSGLGLKRERWFDVMLRGKRSVTARPQVSGGQRAPLQLISRADALIEGFSTGVMEPRTGLGCRFTENKRLVYARMTGWGQEARWRRAQGMTSTNIGARRGACCTPFSRKGQAPVPPLNLVGDFGGGGMLLAFGVVCALHEGAASAAAR